MASSADHFMSAIIILGMLIMILLDSTVAQIGVCYGRNGVGLPSPCEVVDMYNQYNIQSMRIYEPDQSTLQALSGSNTEVTLGVPNRDYLQFLAASQANADAWIETNVRNYPDVRFKYIAVGNEVSPINGDTSQYVPFVLDAMRNVYNSISAAGLGDQISVSTAIDTNAVENAYPPEDGVFKSDVTSYLSPIIQFLVDTGAPLFVNIYPYYAYLNNQDRISLEYALLQPNSGVTMPDGTVYENLFYALLDAMYAALEKSTGEPSILEKKRLDKKNPPPPPKIVVSESGWSSGGGDKKITNVDNARIYNTNLIQAARDGTPKRPGEPIEIYIFAMFDESDKGAENEKHFGMFLPDGEPKYSVSFD